MAMWLAISSLAACWCLALPSAAEDDATALIQGSLRASQRSVDNATGSLRASVRSDENATALEGAGEDVGGVTVDKLNPNFVDCAKYPGLCAAPFHCDRPVTLSDLMTTTFHLVENGHPNLRSWCMAGQYAGYINECVVNKNLNNAAQLQFEWAKMQRNGVDEVDASYCFMEGHCTNKAVRSNTTVEEAEHMCNRRLGKRGWTSFSVSQVMPLAQKFSLGTDKLDGFHGKDLSTFYLRMACAMGSYHCDVVYCRETYCKKKYYIKKYGHLLPKTPGHLIKEPVL